MNPVFNITSPSTTIQIFGSPPAETSKVSVDKDTKMVGQSPEIPVKQQHEIQKRSPQSTTQEFKTDDVFGQTFPPRSEKVKARLVSPNSVNSVKNKSRDCKKSDKKSVNKKNISVHSRDSVKAVSVLEGIIPKVNDTKPASDDVITDSAPYEKNSLANLMYLHNKINSRLDNIEAYAMLKDVHERFTNLDTSKIALSVLLQWSVRIDAEVEHLFNGPIKGLRGLHMTLKSEFSVFEESVQKLNGKNAKDANEKETETSEKEE